VLTTSLAEVPPAVFALEPGPRAAGKAVGAHATLVDIALMAIATIIGIRA